MGSAPVPGRKYVKFDLSGVKIPQLGQQQSSVSDKEKQRRKLYSGGRRRVELDLILPTQ